MIELELDALSVYSTIGLGLGEKLGEGEWGRCVLQGVGGYTCVSHVRKERFFCSVLGSSAETVYEVYFYLYLISFFFFFGLRSDARARGTVLFISGSGP